MNNAFHSRWVFQNTLERTWNVMKYDHSITGIFQYYRTNWQTRQNQKFAVKVTSIRILQDYLKGELHGGYPSRGCCDYTFAKCLGITTLTIFCVTLMAMISNFEANMNSTTVNWKSCHDIFCVTLMAMISNFEANMNSTTVNWKSCHDRLIWLLWIVVIIVGSLVSDYHLLFLP